MPNSGSHQKFSLTFPGILMGCGGLIGLVVLVILIIVGPGLWQAWQTKEKALQSEQMRTQVIAEVFGKSFHLEYPADAWEFNHKAKGNKIKYSGAVGPFKSKNIDKLLMIFIENRPKIVFTVAGLSLEPEEKALIQTGKPKQLYPLIITLFSQLNTYTNKQHQLEAFKIQSIKPTQLSNHKFYKTGYVSLKKTEGRNKGQKAIVFALIPKKSGQTVLLIGDTLQSYPQSQSHEIQATLNKEMKALIEASELDDQLADQTVFSASGKH